MTGSPPTPDPAAAPVDLCAADALAERGDGIVFDILLWGQPARAFALRIDGRPVAYVNRCVHVPTELDWLPGKFLDAEGEAIVCAVHGAAYEPAGGRCIGGPCGRGRLIAITVVEEGGRVCWYPSRDIQPAAAATPAPPPAAPPGEPPR